jgi:hypothetical protein
MPFDIGESINIIADTFLKAPIIHTVAKNPIYTALVITFTIILITMFIFRDADTDEPLIVLCLRSGFWIFLLSMGILFLYNKVLSDELRYIEKNTAFEEVFNSTNTAADDIIVPVNINADFANLSST